MPEYLIDQCVTVEAIDQQHAAELSDAIARLLRQHTLLLRIRGVHVCHIEQAPPECPECERQPAA